MLPLEAFMLHCFFLFFFNTVNFLFYKSLYIVWSTPQVREALRVFEWIKCFAIFCKCSTRKGKSKCFCLGCETDEPHCNCDIRNSPIILHVQFTRFISRDSSSALEWTVLVLPDRTWSLSFFANRAIFLESADYRTLLTSAVLWSSSTS